MKLTDRRLWSWIAGLLPVLGLCVLVSRAEVAVHSGPIFRVPIRGYDPRDMIHGQYLRYQFDFNWAGADDCRLLSSSDELAVTGSVRTLQSGCCLCLTRTSDGFNPNVRHADCDSVEPTCDGRIAVTDVMPPLRYFIPEDRAQELQSALSDSETRPASVEFALPPSGKPAIKELYLGTEPWRDALGAGVSP